MSKMSKCTKVFYLETLTVVSRRHWGMWDGMVNRIYGCGVKMTPDINPIYAMLERSCPWDSENVSCVDVGLV